MPHVAYATCGLVDVRVGEDDGNIRSRNPGAFATSTISNMQFSDFRYFSEITTTTHLPRPMRCMKSRIESLYRTSSRSRISAIALLIEDLLKAVYNCTAFRVPGVGDEHFQGWWR